MAAVDTSAIATLERELANCNGLLAAADANIKTAEELLAGAIGNKATLVHRAHCLGVAIAALKGEAPPASTTPMSGAPRLCRGCGKPNDCRHPAYCRACCRKNGADNLRRGVATRLARAAARRAAGAASGGK